MAAEDNTGNPQINIRIHYTNILRYVYAMYGYVVKSLRCKDHAWTHDWHLSCCHCTGTMMTSSSETFSALLALCAGNSPVTGEFPSQRPVTWSFGVFFNLRLSKQCWGWWFETPSRSLWRHCYGMLTCLFRSNHLYQNWPRVKERDRWLVHSPQKGKYCVPVMFSLMLCWTCWMSQTVELSVIWEIMTLT